MKTFIFTVFFSVWMGISLLSFAQKIPTAPRPIRFVNDYVGLLSKSEIKELEVKLSDYADSTSTEVVIVIIDTLQGYTTEDYAQKLVKAWSIGQSDKDNGILILMATKDRTVRIELGLGIEAYVSDEKTKEVIENEIIPYFKNGEFYVGLDMSTTRLIELLKGIFTEK